MTYQTKEEYLSALRRALAFLPQAEQEAAITYYEDYFADAQMSEAEVIRSLGAPERVAAAFSASEQPRTMEDAPVVYEAEVVGEDPPCQGLNRHRILRYVAIAACVLGFFVVIPIPSRLIVFALRLCLFIGLLIVLKKLRSDET